VSEVSRFSEETPVPHVETGTTGPSSAILAALQRLDALLERAVAATTDSLGPAAAADRFRGLYITPDDVTRLLSRAPASPSFILPDSPAEPAQAVDTPESTPSPLDRMAAVFQLDAFDLGLLLIALAPEVDLKYERIYAYLQDDVTRRRPSVELALNLLSPSLLEKLRNRARLGPDAPLVRQGLIRLRAEPPHTSLLAQAVELDPGIVALLLDGGSVTAVGEASGETPPSAALRGETLRALSALLTEARLAGQPRSFYFQGPAAAGQRAAAVNLAASVGAPLLPVDLAALPEGDAEFTSSLASLLCRAALQDAVLFLAGLDDMDREARARCRERLFSALGGYRGVVILSGRHPWRPEEAGPAGVITVPFSVPEFAERRACWQAALEETGARASDEDLDSLSGRFRLTPAQIREAAAHAYNRALWREASITGEVKTGAQSQLALGDLLAGARAQSGAELASLAVKLEPVHGWDDIVLPEEAREQLLELCQRVLHRQQVMSGWGFDRKLSLGKGITALFAGPSGTGKTMSAEVLAAKLGLDLYRIDLAGVVSKYIGETEKNLDRIFNAAENANAILFFDEADALFGKRSEVHDSHDRYANIEIAYLLQKMDQYEGVAILASNLRQNMDEAFTRRLQFIVEFLFPDETYREEIWRRQFPPDAPRKDNIDFSFLSQRFQLSGGGIKNAALGAAYLAAAEGPKVKIGMRHLVRSALREYRKMGRVIDDGEFARFLEEPPEEAEPQVMEAQAFPSEQPESNDESTAQPPPLEADVLV
jgi:SpoVK/Ycf46/Vps4 family AAA+-type ATPase